MKVDPKEVLYRQVSLYGCLLFILDLFSVALIITGRKNKMAELREVCQAGSLLLRHYDNWIQMPNDPVELVPEITHSVSIIQVLS